MKLYQTRSDVIAVWDADHERIVRLESDVEPPTPTAVVRFIEWPGTSYGTVYTTWLDP